jgi:hypothetical protein
MPLPDGPNDRHWRARLVVWIFTILFIAFLFWRQQHNNDADAKRAKVAAERFAYEAAVRDNVVCVNANESRDAFVAALRNYNDALIAVSSSSRQRTPAEQARADEIVATFRAELERDVFSKLGHVKCPPLPKRPTGG